MARHLIRSIGLSSFFLTAMQQSKQESDFVLSMNLWSMMSREVSTKKTIPFTVLATEFASTFKGSPNGFGYSEFLDREALEDEESGFLYDGWITLVAHIFIQSQDEVYSLYLLSPQDSDSGRGRRYRMCDSFGQRSNI